MKLYLDTSALVKLYVEEEGSATVRETIARADTVATTVIAYAEACAAFARRRRERRFIARRLPPHNPGTSIGLGPLPPS